ncbi:hypothetical protein DLE04_07080 [Actinobacteria bacterium IMCC26103]|nr:hypothetical protein DLE04_07080 [Actinobacteria bacterium IMCC26103]
MGTTEMIKSKKLALALALGLALNVAPATAVTKSPTPTPTASVTKAPATKAPIKKAPVKKKKKVVKLTPSPSPSWPPVGFKTDKLNETKLYLKVPTAKELVGILSAKSALASQIKACTKFTCGAVLVASETGCRWWQITADVVGATSPENRTLKTFGKITTSVTRSAAQQVVTILLVTSEPIGAGHIVSNISADCNQSEPTGQLPNTDYQVVAG